MNMGTEQAIFLPPSLNTIINIPLYYTIYDNHSNILLLTLKKLTLFFPTVFIPLFILLNLFRMFP